MHGKYCSASRAYDVTVGYYTGVLYVLLLDSIILCCMMLLKYCVLMLRRGKANNEVADIVLAFFLSIDNSNKKRN